MVKSRISSYLLFDKLQYKLYAISLIFDAYVYYRLAHCSANELLVLLMCSHILCNDYCLIFGAKIIFYVFKSHYFIVLTFVIRV